MKRIFTLYLSLFTNQNLQKKTILLFAFTLISFVGISQQVTNITFLPVAGAPTSLSINWTNGTGAGRIVVVKSISGAWTPVNGNNITSLNANPSFTAGTNDQDAGSGVAAVVFAGTGSGPVIVTDLVSGTPYFVQIYEFTNSAANPTYNLTTNTTNPKGFTFYTSTGTFITPADVTTVTAQAFGAGGGGGRDGTNTNGFPGGGGGAYAAGTASVSFGVNPTVTVGTGGTGSVGTGTDGTAGGDSSFGTAVVAKGGSVNNSGATGAQGGQAGASTGNITTQSGGNGGNGGTGTNDGGGGGGSSASTSAAGVNGGNFSTTTGGTGGDGVFGDGGNGGNDGAVGQSGTFPGGGGGGRGDAGANSGNGANGVVIVSYNDNTAPVISSINLQTPATSPTNSTSLTFRVTYNETVTGVTNTNFNATITGVGFTVEANTGFVVTPVGGSDGKQYDVTVDVTSAAGINGTVRLDADATPTVSDMSGNNFTGTKNGDQTYTVDRTAPTIVSITRQNPSTSPTNADALIWEITFDEAINAASINTGTSDFTLSNTTATITNVAAQSTTVYRLTASGGDLAGLNNTVTLTFTGGFSITDLAGNALSNTTPSGTNDNSFLVDNAAPRIASITRQNPTTSPTNADAVTWDVTFDEAVVNADAADFTITGSTATITTFSAQSATLYRITASGGDLATLDGTITLNVAASPTIADNANNAFTNPAPTGTNNNTFLVDNSAPRIASITRQNPTSSPTNADAVTWDVTFNEPVVNADASDFTITGSTATITTFTAQSTTLYRITASGGNLATLSGTITLNVAASPTIDNEVGIAFSNPAPTGTNDNTFDVENTAPTIVSITRQNPSTSPTNADALIWEITFDEAINAASINTGTSDFTLSNTTATITNVAAQSTTVYRVTASGGDLAGLNNTVTLTFTGGFSITDLAGNALSNTTPSGTNDNSFLVDNAAPRIASITRQNPTTSPTNADAVTWDVTFDEAVVNADAADFTITGSTATITTFSAQSATLYRITASGGDLAGLNTTITLNVAASPTIADNANNAFTNPAPTGTNNNTFLVDNSAPRIATITRQNPTSSPTNADAVTWDVTFNEAVINADAADFTITGSTATITTFTAQSSTVYRITASGGNLAGLNSTITLNVDVSPTIADNAGNAFTNPAPTGTNNNTFLIDNIAPTIAGTPAWNSGGGGNETVTISFSEPINFTDGATAISGFAPENGAISARLYTSASNTIRLTSNNNNQWDPGNTGKDQITYTNPASPNPVRDLAGNELATTTFTFSSQSRPVLTSSMVLFPNGTGAETIEFLVDQPLLVSSGSSVSGLSVSSGSIGTAIYTYDAANVIAKITLTNGSADGTWTSATTVSYSGTGTIASSAGSMLALTDEKIILSAVSIASNNANTSFAKSGDVVTVTFTLNKNTTSAPTATIDGSNATITRTSGSANTAGAVYTATRNSFTTQVTPLQFVITLEETNRTTNVTATLDGTSVTYDATAPNVSALTIASNNTRSTSFARGVDGASPANTVTLDLTINELVPASSFSAITVNSGGVAIAGSKTVTSFNSTNPDTRYTITFPIADADTDGPITFSYSFTDRAGNNRSVTQTAITDGSSVTVDNTVPTVTSINRITASPTTLTTIQYTVNFSETVYGIDVSDFVLTNTSTASGTIASVSSTSGSSVTVTVNGITGDGDIRLDVKTLAAGATLDDQANNALTAGFTGGQTITVDNNPPTVSSIDINPLLVESWSSANGSRANSLTWTVTFNEPVTGVSTTNFQLNGPGGAQYTADPVILTGSGSVYTLTLNNVKLNNSSSNVQLYWDVKDQNNIVDVVGNTLGGPTATDGEFFSVPPFTGNDYYTVLHKEPVNPAFNPIISAQTPYSFSLNWSNLAETNINTNDMYFFIEIKKSTVGSFNALIDGTIPSDFNYADDNRIGFLYYGLNTRPINIQSYTGLTLESGHTYDVRITPVSYSGFINGLNHYDYATGISLTTTASTTRGSNDTWSTVSSAGSISSLTNAATGALVHTFNLTDDGSSPSIDNAPTKFSQLVIKAGALNTVANWSTTIAGAQLVDEDGNTLSHGVNGVTVSIGTNTITFNNIPSTQASEFGFVEDNEIKTFNLRVWLTNPLVVNDNSKLAFRLDDTSILTYNDNLDASNSSRQSSRLLLGTAAESGAVNINVYATRLVFTQNPQSQIGVATTFATATGTPDPVVQAQDANGNLDTDYNASITITSGLTFTTTHTSFTSGVLTLSNFSFSSAGSSTITVSGNSVALPIAYPALVGGGVEAVSSSITTVISNATTISEATVPGSELASFSSITTAIPANFNFDFTITDDVGRNISSYDDNDGLPTLIQTLTIAQGGNNGANDASDGTTFDDWTKSIAGAQITDGISSVTITNPSANITGNSLIFNIPGTSSMRTIADGGNKTYQLRIWLRNPVDPTIADILDNKDFSFTINQSNVGLNPTPNTTSSLANSSASTDDNRNVVTVTATRLAFTTQWLTNATYNYDASINSLDLDLVTGGTQLLRAKAQDANGNLDINYTTAATVTASGDAPATYPLANSTVTPSAGQYTFDGNLQITSAGGGLNNANATLTLTSGTLFGATSNNIRLTYSGASDIVKDGTFTYPTNIAYETSNNQTTDITSGTGVAVERFTVRDGGGSTDSDGSATKLSSITLRVTNYQYLRRLAIYNQTSGDEVGEKDMTVPANYTIITPPSVGVPGVADVTFSGIPASGVGSFAAPDNANPSLAVNNLIIKVSFNSANVLDNEVISFQVTTVIAGGVSSAFGNQTPSGIQSTVTADENKIEVNATQLDITSPTGSVNASLNSNFSGVVVEARDVFANRDLDFNGIITDLTNPLNRTTINGPVEGTTAFTAGVYTFASNFQFTSGANGDDVTLTIKADDTGGNSGTTCGGNAICSGISPTITLLTSFESSIVLDPTFTIPARIPYVGYQATDIQNTSTSYELARVLLVDGSRGPGFIYGGGPAANLNTNTDSGDGFPNSDSDGAATVLTDLTVRVFKPSTIRRIALYANGTEVPGTEIDVDALNLTDANATYDFVWSGMNVSAADNTELPISIRVSFMNTTPELDDRDDIRLDLISAAVGTGSQFFIGAGYVAGQPNGADSSFGLIDVVATSLDFVGVPSSYAGTNEPLGPTYTASTSLPSTTAAIVHARDKFALRDLDFNYPSASITLSGGGATSNAAFLQGVLNLDGMEYRNSGNGTLVVQAGGLNSSVVPSDNIGFHTPGQNVEVINVNVSAAAIGTPTNLKGGTPGAILLGVTFTPEYATTSEPSLKKFIFSFDAPYQTATTVILKNFKVRLGATDVTTTGATVNTGSSTNNTNLDLVIVDWGANPPVELFDVNTGNPVSKTFYLVADVDVTAKIGTQAMTPALIDLGYGKPSDQNIITSKGTARANVIGNTYTFASTRPPVLLTNSTSLTSPYNGQLNVDKNIMDIYLEFDIPVWSLDGAAELWDKSTNVKVANLTAVTGNFVTGGGVLTPTANPIRFAISFLNGRTSLDDDALYYVTIKQGSFDNLNGTGQGISDDGFNYFGGISSSSILFFKTSSPNPPVLSLASNVFSNLTSEVFKTTFDQRGTAYYLIVPTGSPKPTNNEVDGTSVYSGGAVLARGSYSITLINSPQTVTVDLPTPLSPNTTYDVWIYAKNDANPTNIPTSAPYGGGTGYPVTGTTPTLKFTTPTLSNIRPGFVPDYSLCPDSYFTLTDPIIIGEVALGDFQAGVTQDFNILLPTGFEFDGINKPTVLLIGADFTTPSATVNWVNNTIINISYQNTTATSRDKIIITNLRIKGASGSNPGNIRRFAGNASIGSIITLATVSNLNVAEQKFTNSYSLDNDFTPFGFGSNATITAIPDNYVDSDPNISGGIRLIPQITPANDYGITFFTGNGVTNDVLSLGAVAPNTAFDITMTHTDLNGCISNNAVQYVVYDHTTPISNKLGSNGGTQQALSNPNFPADAPTAVIPSLSLPRINYKDLAGYKLLSIKANIPSRATATSQIIFGPAWQYQVSKIPKSVSQPIDSDLPSALGYTSYNEYQWDYSHILNAVSETLNDPLNVSGLVTTNPYDNFKQVTANGNTYWTGGSLGKVEFTGTFQSTADLSFIVPFRQEVELFVPAIPLIEVDQSNQPIKGVTNYCEFGGGILINGFPAASAGSSTGSFTIFDALTNAPLQSSAPNSAFVDNGNGTATIFPYLIINNVNVGITNGYNPIKVVYTYQQNNSPAVGRGEIVLRITPNPVPDFTTSTLCEDIPVTFTDTSMVPTASGVTIAAWDWSFGDINSPNNASTDQNPDHIYVETGLYTPVRLDVTTNAGCKSTAPKTSSLEIGGTPDVKFTFDGVSKADSFNFLNGSEVSSNDSFNKLEWDYGDNSTIATVNSNFSTPITHNYTNPGLYTVNLKVTSTIGCVNSLDKQLIVLDRVTPTPIQAYDQNFETTNANWQASNLPFIIGKTNQAPSSWAYGNPTFNAAVTGTPNTTKMWKTNLTGGYNPREESALYSPSFDLSQLDRPMVSFNSFVQFINSDGVVIQYSTDDKNVADPTKKWEVLGVIGSGVDWINEQNIAAKPGQQVTGDYGWSGLLKTDWRESKYAIANEPGKSPVNKATKIVFRFALGSVRDVITDDGFAIDNFRLGERTRTVLLESFANVANTDPSEKIVNDYIRDTFNKSIGTDVVKLNYHVGFPGMDPFNQDNQADLSSRALYYEIARTPKSALDGNDGSTILTPNFNTWGERAYNTQTLQLANADILIHAPGIDVTAPPLINADGITFEVTVNAKTTGLVADRTILHTVIVEQSVSLGALSQSQQAMVKSGENQFSFIVKKMLPSAAGTRLTTALPGGTTKKFGPFTWKPDPTKFYSPNTGDLAIVAFLQDEVNRTVYQSEIITNLNDPTINVVTGMETILPEQVNVFPNPANREFVVELPGIVQNDIELNLIDQVGRMHSGGKIPAGKNAATVDAGDLAEGIYILQIGSGSNGAVRKKVMIVRKD